MSALGALLELIHGAPRRYRTLDARLTVRRRRSKDTVDLHLPFPAREPDESVAPLTLVEGPEELTGESIERHVDELVKRSPPPDEKGEMFPELWDPTLLLTNFWLEPEGEAEHRGRSAIRVRATERDSGDDYARLGARGDHDLLVDSERGIVLRAESLSPDRPEIWDLVDAHFDGSPGNLTEAPSAPRGVADILELLYTAKRRFSTIHASITDRDSGRSGHPDHYQVWFHSRWRWRCERESRDGHEIEIANEDRFWRITDGQLVDRETVGEDGFRGWWEVPFEEMWDGAHLIPRLWLEPQARKSLRNHEALSVRVTPRATSEYWEPNFLHDMVEGELVVDANAGIIRRMDMRGGPFSTFVRELVEVELDPDLPPDLFVYGEGE